MLMILVLATALADPAPAEVLPLTAEQVMQRVEARAKANGPLREGIAWVKSKTVYDVGDVRGDHVREALTWRMWVQDGITWQQLMSKNGKPKNGKPEPPDANLAAGLITWYTFRLDEQPLQPEPGTGILCWVIHFAPSGKGKPHGIMEEVASRMRGVMYIDERGFWIRSAAGDLPEPYRKFLVINAQRVQFSLRQSEVLGAVVTHSLEVRFLYSVLGSNSAQRHEYSYQQFTLMTQTPPP